MKIFLYFLSLTIFFSGLRCGAQTAFRVSLGVEIQSLDPSEAEDFVTVRLISNLGWGLTRFNSELKALPALAESWTVSRDKKVYTFKAPLSLDMYFDSQEKNNLIAARIQKEIEENLKVKLNLRGMEWKSYLNLLKDPVASPAFYRFAWLATFPDPLSHLQVFKSDSPNNYSGFKNKKYDDLVDLIAETPEGDTRKKLIMAAQKVLLTDELVIVPLFHYVQYLLIRDRWQGLDLSPMGILYFQRAHLRSSL